MNVRNMVILFLSVLAISLVILIIIFSLFFKNIDFSFNTHAPVTAPKIGDKWGESSGAPARSKAEDVNQSSVHVPGEELPNTSTRTARPAAAQQHRLPEDEIYYQEDNGAGSGVEVVDPYAVTDRDKPAVKRKAPEPSPLPAADPIRNTPPLPPVPTGPPLPEVAKPSSSPRRSAPVVPAPDPQMDSAPTDIP